MATSRRRSLTAVYSMYGTATVRLSDDCSGTLPAVSRQKLGRFKSLHRIVLANSSCPQALHCQNALLTQPVSLNANQENSHETATQSGLPNPSFSILLRPGSDLKSERTQATWDSTNRRRTAPKGVPRTPLECGNAETTRQKDNHAEKQMRPLRCRLHGLRRHRAGPYQSAGHGRRMARRSPG